MSTLPLDPKKLLIWLEWSNRYHAARIK